MKLIFDQNISPKIVKLVTDKFPGSTQVRFVGLENASDIEIFEFAKTNNFVIVTFDSDFVDLNLIRGIPPKIIWIKTGNLTTKAIAEIIQKSMPAIAEFSKTEKSAILEIIKPEF